MKCIGNRPAGVKCMLNNASTISLRLELLTELDQQIEMLAAKTFSAFSREELVVFRSREQRIRELQQCIASVPAMEQSQIETMSVAWH